MSMLCGRASRGLCLTQGRATCLHALKTSVHASASAGFDGVDLDYEPGSPACKASAGGVSCATDSESVAVTTALRNALPKGQYILSTATFHVGCYGTGAFVSSKPTWSQYFGVNLAMARSSAGQQLDLINIMVR